MTNALWLFLYVALLAGAGGAAFYIGSERGEDRGRSEAALTDDETRSIVAYLQKYGQRPLDARQYPEVNQPSGEAFRLACNQCHVLPDPKRHTAAEWPRVVARMQENMQWMNRVVGSRPVSGEPQLRIEEINAFLEKYARR